MRTALVLALSILAGPLAAGPTFNVGSTSDAVDANPGDGFCATAQATCTLRAAVMEANHHAASTVVVPAGTYALDILGTCMGDTDACGDLNVDASMTITGSPGTIIDATGLGDSIFRVGAGATLTLSHVTLQNSSANGGAVVLVQTAGLVLSDARVTSCTSTGSGGGAITAGSGTATLTRVTIDACHAPFLAGGAIFMNGGNLSLVSCTLTGNSSDYGGAVYEDGTAPQLLVKQTTISGNDAVVGGALYVRSTSGTNLRVVNSTITGNNATHDGGGIAGIDAAYMLLYNATVTNNQADSDFSGAGTGGGVYVDATATLTIYNTILAGNFETHFNGSFWAPNIGECAGAFFVSAASVMQNYNSGHCTPMGVPVLADPKLGALADNGGFTKTQVPLADSPAIDNASTIPGCIDENGSPLLVDQRGVKRPIGVKCDIGAFEVEPIGDANGDGVVNVADVFYLINRLFAGGAVPLGRANVNGDSAIDVSDVFYLINYLFAGGPAPV